MEDLEWHMLDLIMKFMSCPKQIKDEIILNSNVGKLRGVDCWKENLKQEREET